MVLRRCQLPGAFDTLSFGDGRVLAVASPVARTARSLKPRSGSSQRAFPGPPRRHRCRGAQGHPVSSRNWMSNSRRANDVYVIVPPIRLPGRSRSSATRAARQAGHHRGGGNIGLYVARAMEAREKVVRSKVIEANRNRAVEISEDLERTVVLHGNALPRNFCARRRCRRRILGGCHQR